jgi:hypothetical protein
MAAVQVAIPGDWRLLDGKYGVSTLITLQRHLVIDSIASALYSASRLLTTYEEAEDGTSLADGR